MLHLSIRCAEIVDGDACGDAHIERVLGAVLWDLQAVVSILNDFVRDAVYLVAYDQHRTTIVQCWLVTERDALMSLLEGENGASGCSAPLKKLNGGV